jgi:hypothetical protein
MHVIKLSSSASSFSLTSTGAISSHINFGGTLFTSLCFGYLDTILFLRISFLFLLVFVLLVDGKGSMCSDGELDSCAW